jgi:outer membrane protein OmpA-like peptidoglycan-associated protein
LGLSPPKASPASQPAAVPAAPATPPLSEVDREKLQAQLTQLQSELAKLSSQTTLSEGDRAKQAAGLQERIRIIQQQLNPAAPATAPIVPPTTSKVSGNDTLLVTLPTDSLFSDNQTTLKPGAEAILDSILIDLQRYPAATIRISAHSDAQADEADDRARTFEQATAIEGYLSGKLNETYHWTVAGYGHSQPLAASTDEVNRQRNRRIEIAIEP